MRSTRSEPGAGRRRLLLAGGAALVAGGALPVILTRRASAVEAAVVIPPPAQDIPPDTRRLHRATLAGGCFWGVQGVYQHVKGVQRAVSGYSGGTAATAHYDAVSSGSTDHAESVEVTYDPSVVSYGALLQIFFSVVHDPTQLDRQGPDTGRQYRSEIFAHGPQQLEVAKAYIAQLDAARVYPAPIVTRLAPEPSFFPAERYHQDYMIENPHNPYIAINDLPKVEHLKRLFPDRYRSDPVLVKKPV
ncbi:MAG: peptide-methionine (S)-S-oxide reductase MsrA [Lautropia sp.]